MLSSSFLPKPLSLSHHHHHHHLLHHSNNKLKPISASSDNHPPSKLILPNTYPNNYQNSPAPKLILPSTNNSSNSNSPSLQPNNFYQPFRPPATPLPPKYRSLDTAGRIQILADRLGLWFEYAPLISSLFSEGFTPPTVEEITGITGVDQNRLVVAAQVRASLADPHSPPSHQLPPELLSHFDSSSADVLLYEIRLLNASQRASAARFIVLNSLDGKSARALARAIKDFPFRRGEPGWDSFDYELPGDCLSYAYLRLSREHDEGSSERKAALNSAVQAAESDSAKARVLEEVEGRKDGEGDVTEEEQVKVPVVRMLVGEVAEATTVVLLPSCKAGEGGVEGLLEAPVGCRSEGGFGVVEAEKAWRRWVVLPGWEPVVGLGGGGGGVVVEFEDAKVLPWRANKWYREEPILVVVDRRKRGVEADEGFYLAVLGDGGELKVKKGLDLKGMGIAESLGSVVMVVRPPKEEYDDQLSEEDWD